MRDRPDSSALLSIVAETLRTDVIPQLSGPAAYQARIAASLIGIVARALDRGGDDDAAEIARLRALLDCADGGALLDRADGDLSSLTADLAARLRDGRLNLDQPAVAEHLWVTTLAKLAIDQPGFARYRQLIDGSPPDANSSRPVC